MASSSEGYFGRAWGLLTRDKGWWKPVLVLALATFVPIVGPLGVLGYELEWARLTAWGVDSAPKQKGVRVGECISSGWRGFVTILGWMIAWGIVSAILSAVSLFGLLNLAVFVAGFFVNTLLLVCAIRATIYQKIGAGYQANRIADMVKADFEGVARVTGIYTLSQMIVGLVAGLLSLMAFMPLFVQIAAIGSRAGRAMTESQVAGAILNVMSQAIPAVLVIVVVCTILGTIVSLVSITAAALWVRNFDVSSWGESGDPIPCLTSATATAATTPASAAPFAAPAATAAPDAPSAVDASSPAPTEDQVGEKESEPTSSSEGETIEEIPLTQSAAPAGVTPTATPTETSEEGNDVPRIAEAADTPEPETDKMEETDESVEKGEVSAPEKSEAKVADDAVVEQNDSPDETAGKEDAEA